MSSSPEKMRGVSRYEVLRQLAQGPLTRVFLAALRENSARTELLALELLRKELARDDALRALFLAQAAATLSLAHPNIAHTHAVVADTEACGLALELVAGQSLAQLLERMGRSEIPLALHLQILCNVLDALHHIHQQPQQRHSGHPQGMRLVHGEVSPSNVMLSYDGEVKVVGVGFGQLGAAKVGAAKVGAAKVGVDDLGSDVGYRAPELFLGYAPSPAADVYSVGVMLWEALARCRRSFGIDARAVARQRTRGEEPDIGHVSTDAPKGLRAACRRALAVSRRDRFETALELKAEIETYLADGAAQSATAANIELAQLMRQLFEREREEMQLFIGSSLGTAVPGAAPPEALETPPEALETPPEAPQTQCSHAVSSAPPAESESGEHRAYSASLVHPPPVARRARRRVLLIAAAGLALASGVTARWLERARGTNDASARLALHSEQSPVAPVTPEPSVSPATPAPSEAAPADNAEATRPPTAFLDTAPSAGALPSPKPPEPPPAPPSDAERLAADEHGARLQDALVAAARSQRARLARREAARRTARQNNTASARQNNTASARQNETTARQDDDTAPLPSSTRPAREPLPRAIDEIDPYGT